MPERLCHRRPEDPRGNPRDGTPASSSATVLSPSRRGALVGVEIVRAEQGDGAFSRLQASAGRPILREAGMTFKACVQHLELGSLLPPRPAWEVEADANGQPLHQRARPSIEVPGLQRAMQFFRTLVCSTPDGRAAEHLILEATDPHFSERRLVSLTPLLADFAGSASLSLLVISRTGWAKVFPGPAAPSIAIAVAAVKSCYGWDESEPIVVKAGRLSYAVSGPSDGCAWSAELSAV
ncbi:hypothetical protein WMF26_32855 [Sorangium sp. So ce185]|uniref:hypothetical protein n=1 Tax=Sorangium sp. So ce185 TaxID=3133287 RepID=UPI003F620A4B